MLDRRRTVESIGLELAALRIEHTLTANLVTRLADLLYLTPGERDALAALRAEHAEVAAWAAGLVESFPPAGAEDIALH